MKKIIIAIVAALTVTSCGVGSYSVTSGKADQAEISFVAAAKLPISVIIDGSQYNVETVKEKAYKTKRNIKKTAANTIDLAPGKHEVKVISAGREVYNKTLMISVAEHRIVEL